MSSVDTDGKRILAAVRHLRPHQHVCSIYENKSDQLSMAVAFILGGLERGETLYIADTNEPEAILSALQRRGIDADAALRSGRLTVSDNRPYLQKGRFVPGEMIRFLADRYRAAQSKSKHSAFRLAGEMTWVLGSAAGADRLLEYEAKLNDFLRRRNALCLCQYDRHRFSDEVILGVLRTHPLVVYGNMMAENPYYIPPADFLSGKSSPVSVDRYLKTLRDHAEAKEKLRNVSLLLLHSEDTERRRIARELHDTTGQSLTALAMNLASLRKSVKRLSANERKILARSLKLAKQSARDISTISYLLHPPMLDEFGLADAIRWYVRGFSRRSRIGVKLTIDPKLGRLPRDAELAVFRVLQEGLNNIRKHSKSGRADVQVVLQDKLLVLELRDFGHGVSPSHTSQPLESLGIGIAGMRERLQQYGGDMELHSTKGGTLVRGMLPLESAAS
jgi:signal transduction histidine kinase